MKLLTFAVPCYNSQAYMEHCVETLLEGGDDVEIILVDDGSKDDTGAIADRYAAQYPDIVRVVHQENGGHGEGVNQGLRRAQGLYYKVVDSDDWADVDAAAWYAEAVNYVIENGIMGSTSTDAKVFTPNGTVTRATVYQTLYNLEGKPAVTEAASFADVAGTWYADSAA